jgi:hypothetical protein
VSKSIDLKKFLANGTGPAAQLANAFREAHENVVFRSIEDLNAAMQKFTQGLNSAAREDFLGLSPNDLQEILYGEFSLENSIFSFVSQCDVSAEKIPILREAVHYLNHLATVGEVKLTATGSMPRAYDYACYWAGNICESSNVWNITNQLAACKLSQSPGIAVRNARAIACTDRLHRSE